MTPADPEPEEKAQTEPPPRGPTTWGWQRLLMLVLSATILALVGIQAVKQVRRDRTDARFAVARSIDLTEPAAIVEPLPAKQNPRRPKLRVAIAPVISPESSMDANDRLGHYLAGKLGREGVVMKSQTYAQTNDLVRYRRCDLAMVCTYAFIRGQQEFGMQALAVPVINGKTSYHSYIIVPTRSRAQSLLDLGGKRFGSADIMSNSGWLYPAIWLKERHKDPDRFFSKHVITGSHDRSVQAVVAGLIDGAAVDSLVYDQMATMDPSLTTSTRILMCSPPFGMPPLVVHPHLDGELKEQLLAQLLAMHEDESGRGLLAALGDRTLRGAFARSV